LPVHSYPYQKGHQLGTLSWALVLRVDFWEGVFVHGMFADNKAEGWFKGKQTYCRCYIKEPAMFDIIDSSCKFASVHHDPGSRPWQILP
jgi:hypothetical protein